MVDFDLKKVLFEELGYDNSPEIKQIDMNRAGRAIPHVDQVYTVQDVQVAYFSQFKNVNNEDIWNLHKAVWNESKTPLLFVILPQEIRVYNGYALPASSPDEVNNGERLLRILDNIASVEEARQEIRKELYKNHYDRIHLETGSFWDSPDGQRINKNTRADSKLLQDLGSLRRALSQSGLKNNMDHAYTIIGRSILIRYMEDRGILFGQSEQYSNRRDFTSQLDDIGMTYEFFDSLANYFKGDLFPVSNEEREIITQTHLDLVSQFLQGTNPVTGQLSFWPYDFEYIPIELIEGCA